MEKWISVKQAAEKWNVSERRVSLLCKEGRIDGVRKEGMVWMIPEEAVKPVDHRVRSGRYCKTKVFYDSPKLPLPVGVSNYCLASTEYYYVDKTMLIKEFIDERPMVTLFTRPRRFGKTLNMDMLRTYFEKTDKDTSVYFQNKKIWKCGQKYRDYQGKYPVLFLTFKDLRFKTWEDTFEGIRHLFAKEVERHPKLLEGIGLDEYSKKAVKRLSTGEASEVELSSALSDLSKALHQCYGIAPVLIIDEYDTPIQQGYMEGFYDQVILFMRNLFSGGFKDNPHLSFGFLTGILRVAKESVFSGMNNLAVYSVLDDKYSSYFGFTKDEVRQMAKYYGAEGKTEELLEWYDGYHFGNTSIFNPWSLICYFNNGCEPRPYWVSTGNNEIIRMLLKDSKKDTFERLKSLINGNHFTTYIDTSVIYPRINENTFAIYSFLLVTGYLNVMKKTPSVNGDFICEVGLPNKEIAFVYNKEILSYYQIKLSQSD